MSLYALLSISRSSARPQLFRRLLNPSFASSSSHGFSSRSNSKPTFEFYFHQTHLSGRKSATKRQEALQATQAVIEQIRGELTAINSARKWAVVIWNGTLHIGNDSGVPPHRTAFVYTVNSPNSTKIALKIRAYLHIYEDGTFDYGPTSGHKVGFNEIRSA